jgi:hypothetical protein
MRAKGCFEVKDVQGSREIDACGTTTYENRELEKWR